MIITPATIATSWVTISNLKTSALLALLPSCPRARRAISDFDTDELGLCSDSIMSTDGYGYRESFMAFEIILPISSKDGTP
jgi:hypothetical protein